MDKILIKQVLKEVSSSNMKVQTKMYVAELSGYVCGFIDLLDRVNPNLF